MKKADTGIITSIKIMSNPPDNVYFALFKDKVERMRSDLLLDLYETVVVESDKFVSKGKADAKEYEKRLEELVDGLCAKECQKSGIDDLDLLTEKMTPELSAAARRFMKNVLTGSPVLVRFHNDCDGSSGTVALYKAVAQLSKKIGLSEPAIIWKMNRGVYYPKELLDSDLLVLRNYSSIEKPIVFITDFGTAPESDISVGAAKNIADLIWLDHHPIHESFPQDEIPHYINPWNYGGDSDYTAGFLTSSFAELVFPADARRFKLAALIGDYSRYGNRSDKAAVELSTVLDHLTSRKDLADGLTPRYVESVIDSEESFDEAFGYAERLFEESIDLGMRSIKHHKTKDDINIFVLDFQKVSDESPDYPLPGRYSSRLQDHLEKKNGGKSMTVVHYGNYISLRIGREITKRVNIHERMEGLKESNPYILSFGGHENAGSIRVDKDHAKEVIKLLLKDLGVTLK